jgi:hypothetical protein
MAMPSSPKKRTPRSRPRGTAQPMSEQTWTLRQQILMKYGGHCTCPCGCRDTNLRRLQLDHIDGGGTDEREHLRGNKLYQKLLADPVRGDFRLLCAGCHVEITMYRECLGTPAHENNHVGEAHTSGTGGDVKPQQPPQEPPVDPFAHTREETFRRAEEARLAKKAAERHHVSSRWQKWWGRRG